MTDAFDALRADTSPVDPPPGFADRLRARLADHLADLTPPTRTEPTMTSIDTSTSGTPSSDTSPGTAHTEHTVTPYLSVSNAAAAIDFYVAVLGAVEHHRLLDGDRIGHAELVIGDSRIALADEYPEYEIVGADTLGGSPVALMVDVPDVDATFARAITRGATELRAPADQFHGHRTGQFRDPWGHRWTVSAPIHDRYREEAEAAGFEYREAAGGSQHQVKHHDRGDLFYFTLPTTDLARSKAFFGAVLGWQFGDDPERGHIENIAAPPGGLFAGSTQVELWFVVDDIEAAVATVRRLGGTAQDPVSYDSGWAAECTDDQGTRFCLSVPADKYTR